MNHCGGRFGWLPFGPIQIEWARNRSLYRPAAGALNWLNFGSTGSYAPHGTPTPSSSRAFGSADPTVSGALPARTSGWPANPSVGNVARSGDWLNALNAIRRVNVDDSRA